MGLTSVIPSWSSGLTFRLRPSPPGSSASSEPSRPPGSCGLAWSGDEWWQVRQGSAVEVFTGRSPMTDTNRTVPSTTSSPSHSRAGDVSRMPLTRVPFFESRSSIVTESAVTMNRAWCHDVCTDSTGMPADGSRPATCIPSMRGTDRGPDTNHASAGRGACESTAPFGATGSSCTLATKAYPCPWTVRIGLPSGPSPMAMRISWMVRARLASVTNLPGHTLSSKLGFRNRARPLGHQQCQHVERLGCQVHPCGIAARQ